MSEKPEPDRTWTSPPSWSVATSIGVLWVVAEPTLPVNEAMTFWVAWLPAVVRPAMKMLPTWWVSTASLEDCLGAVASTPTIMSWPTFSSRLRRWPSLWPTASRSRPWWARERRWVMLAPGWWAAGWGRSRRPTRSRG